MNHNILFPPLRLRAVGHEPAPAARSSIPEMSPSTPPGAMPSASSSDITVPPAQRGEARFGPPGPLRPRHPAVGVGAVAHHRPGRPQRAAVGPLVPHQRFSLRMAGFSDAQIAMVQHMAMLEGATDRILWFMAHYEALLQHNFSPAQILEVVQLASRQARRALFTTAGYLLEQGFTHGQLVSMAITACAGQFLMGLMEHCEILLSRDYTHADLMLFARCNQGSKRLRKFAAMYWPERAKVPPESRHRIRDAFLLDNL
jgi:hypothetical protein